MMIGTSEKNSHNMDEGSKVPNWILSQLVQEGLTFIVVVFIWGHRIEVERRDGS